MRRGDGLPKRRRLSTGVGGCLARRGARLRRVDRLSGGASDPALAAVGLTETEASERGYDVAVGSIRVRGARPLAIGDTRGRLKAVVNQADGEILGFHILAPHGDDLLHEVVAAMHDHGGIERIAKSIHAHPTLNEMVKATARAAN